MTIIIALKDKKNKKIILGADKQTTRGQIILKAKSKLFTIPLNITNGYGEVVDKKEIHVAFAGSVFMKSFMQYGFTVPNMDENQNFVEYLYSLLLPTIQQLVTDQQLVEIDNSQLDTDTAMIFVYNDEIYRIGYNLGVIMVDEEFVVDGSGWEVAIGSLYTNLKYHSDMEYEEIVKQAIISAGENTVYCNSDFEIKIIEY